MGAGVSVGPAVPRSHVGEAVGGMVGGSGVNVDGISGVAEGGTAAASARVGKSGLSLPSAPAAN